MHKHEREKGREEESFVCLVIEDDTPSSHGSTDTKSLGIYTVTKRAAAAPVPPRAYESLLFLSGRKSNQPHKSSLSPPYPLDQLDDVCMYIPGR